jgi:hypothetical protein
MKKIAYTLSALLLLLQTSAIAMLFTNHNMNNDLLSFVILIICAAPLLGVAIIKTQDEKENT